LKAFRVVDSETLDPPSMNVGRRMYFRALERSSIISVCV